MAPSLQELRARVLAGLGALALAIEHVGSTSVPGLAAKPIIDMEVVVAEADLAGEIRRIELLGYRHRGNLGTAGARGAFHAPPGTLPHHLYRCP